jgi:hypothetical protein
MSFNFNSNHCCLHGYSLEVSPPPGYRYNSHSRYISHRTECPRLKRFIEDTVDRDHRSKFLRGQDRTALSNHTGSLPKPAGAASGVPGIHSLSIESVHCHFSRKRKTSGHELCCRSRNRSLVAFSFVLLFAPFFRWVWGPPTRFHRVPCYRCWLAAYPAAAAYSFFCCFRVLLSLCFSDWLTESCCGRVIRLELHIPDEKTC